MTAPSAPGANSPPSKASAAMMAHTPMCEQLSTKWKRAILSDLIGPGTPLSHTRSPAARCMAGRPEHPGTAQQRHDPHACLHRAQAVEMSGAALVRCGCGGGHCHGAAWQRRQGTRRRHSRQHRWHQARPGALAGILAAAVSLPIRPHHPGARHQVAGRCADFRRGGSVCRREDGSSGRSGQAGVA